MTSISEVGRYQIKNELGRGGMAIVYLAYDPNFGRDVALKVLPRALLHDSSFRMRFQREARAIASLEHNSIVPVYDFGEYEGQPYLVMRYMSGGSLFSILAEGPVSLETTKAIIQRLALGLNKAHQNGIIHRDLKPANILFDQDGNAYLSDFGIVKFTEATATLTSTGIIGTPAYMSPEQAQGMRDLDARSDIYALGTILFEMLTGELPYKADTPLGLAVKHITEPVPRILEANPELPPACEEIIAKAMAKRPEARYETALHLLADLTAVSSSTANNPSTVLAEKEASVATALATPLPKLEAVSSVPREKTPKTLFSAKSTTPWLWLSGLLLLSLLAWGALRYRSWVVPIDEATREPVTETAVVAIVATTQTPQSTATSVPAQTNTATPEQPTATLTSIPSKEPTATLTNTPLPTAAHFQVRIVPNSINVRGGPGTNYDVLGFLLADQTVALIAQTSSGNWYLVERDDGSMGWISATVVEAVGELNLDMVEIAATIPAPPPTQTPLPTSTPTRTPVPSSGSGSGSGSNSPKPTFTRPSP